MRWPFFYQNYDIIQLDFCPLFFRFDWVEWLTFLLVDVLVGHAQHSATTNSGSCGHRHHTKWNSGTGIYHSRRGATTLQYYTTALWTTERTLFFTILLCCWCSTRTPSSKLTPTSTSSPVHSRWVFPRPLLICFCSCYAIRQNLTLPQKYGTKYTSTHTPRTTVLLP